MGFFGPPKGITTHQIWPLAFRPDPRQQHIGELGARRGREPLSRLGLASARASLAPMREWTMDADTAFSMDAIVFPLLIAAIIYFAVIRTFYRGGKRGIGK